MTVLRRPSAIPLSPVKPGIYGINTPSPRPFTFAPNVTPGTFVDTDSLSPSTSPDGPPSPSSALFPPSDVLPPAPSRRRVPPGKRRSLGYIPRPPNAFMLFRADFVRQKHVPGSIETNHGSLSKIIGNCWKALPLEEKRIWEVKAKHAKAEHKARYPDYRFRPVHNKNKEKKKDKHTTSPADERRCEELTQLLLEGKKGEDLAAAVRHLDNRRDVQLPPHPVRGHRRSSSVPLPNNYHPVIAIPALSFSSSRPSSPVGNISRSTRMVLGSRRASSAGAIPVRSWTIPNMMMNHPLQHDHSPLPAVDTSLFEPSYLHSISGFPPYNFNDVLSSLPNHATHAADLSFGPLDPLASIQLINPASGNLYPSSVYPGPSLSHTPTTYSGSPANSDHSLPQLVAPQPEPMQPRLSAIWKDFVAHDQPGATFSHTTTSVGYEGAGGIDLNVPYESMDMGVYAGYDMGMNMQMGMGMDMGQFQQSTVLDGMFDAGHIATTAVDPVTMAYTGFEFNDIVHE